ncbi:MAG TPA: alpha/beta hydrolase [Aggregatilineales bacterium]|nr:alpha/beta hydrolase [Anaerolineales bacterium]HRE47968.1 alpha/beta hydrolase [Aggregatilineales bacterium]
MSIQHLNEIDITYDTFGTVSGTPLLLLHGAFLSRRQWAQQVYAFATRYKVITCDLRGHGESGRSPNTYALPLFADDVSKLIAALGYERVILCGHSFGGMVAQEVAITFPAQVSALILAESHSGMTNTFPGTLRTMLGWWLTALISVERAAHNMADQHGKYAPEVAEYLRREINVHARDKVNYLNIRRAEIAFSTKHRLESIEAPTLLLAGEYHPTTHKLISQMRREIKQAVVKIVPNAGYLVNMDNPEGFNRAVLEFLEGLSRPRIL